MKKAEEANKAAHAAKEAEKRIAAIAAAGGK
jgi:hypothetical protein